MDDLERERLNHRHRVLMKRARDVVEEARRMRNEVKPAPDPAHLRSAWLAERTTALISNLQEARLWSQDARAKAREAVGVSQALSSRYGNH